MKYFQWLYAVRHFQLHRRIGKWSELKFFTRPGFSRMFRRVNNGGLLTVATTYPNWINIDCNFHSCEAKGWILTHLQGLTLQFENWKDTLVNLTQRLSEKKLWRRRGASHTLTVSGRGRNGCCTRQKHGDTDDETGNWPLPNFEESALKTDACAHPPTDSAAISRCSLFAGATSSKRNFNSAIARTLCVRNRKTKKNQNGFAKPRKRRALRCSSQPLARHGGRG